MSLLWSQRLRSGAGASSGTGAAKEIEVWADTETLCDRRDFAAAVACGYGVPMTNRWYAYFSLALEGPASS